MVGAATERSFGDATTGQDNPRPVLEMRGVSTRFGATQALEDVSLSLYGRDIHARLGENGAGKSTLIKIMPGIQHPDTGEVLIDGNPVRVNSSQDDQRLG